MKEYERNCLKHVKTMFRNRLPRILKIIEQKAKKKTLETI
jgi:hypothetical protein